MKSILVGIDGSDRGKRALRWAARQAQREQASLTLLMVIDPKVVSAAGGDEGHVNSAANKTLDEAESLALSLYPGLSIEKRLVSGKVVESIVDGGEGHDLIVLGSHHGSSIGETVGGAKPLRVAVSTAVPTAVVPADWTEEYEGTGVVVGIDPDGSTTKAVDFAVEEALAIKQPLRLVTAWGLPGWISKPAEVMGGGLGPVGEQYQANLDDLAQRIKANYPELDIAGRAVEGPAPTRVLVGYSKSRGILVLGTHSRAALGRALFGSVTHSVLQNLTIPTIIVPQD